MPLISEILRQYQLSDIQISELSDKAKKSSIDCGKGESAYELPDNDWTLLYNIANTLWDDPAFPIRDKVIAGFELFNLFPTYFHTLVPYYYLIADKEPVDNPTKNLIWEKFMYYLTCEPCYADPVGYVLWVDLFEDTDTVNECWNGLLSCNQNGKPALRKLLYSSGPVPYELKEPLYNILIKDRQNHDAIFNSILSSVVDIYGKIDKSKARKILGLLEADRKTEAYRFLIEKLK